MKASYPKAKGAKPTSTGRPKSTDGAVSSATAKGASATPGEPKEPRDPKAAAEFLIAIGDLDMGGRAYKFPVRPAWVRGVLEDHEATPTDSAGQFDVRVSKSDDDIAAVGTLRVQLQIPCARCQQMTTFDVDSALSVLFVPKSALKDAEHSDAGEVEFSSGDSDVLAYDGEQIVLDDWVRDELVLETPMIPLCSEACEGMRPSSAQFGDANARSTSNDARNGFSSKEQASQNGKTEKSDSLEIDELTIDPRLAPLLKFKLGLKPS